MTITLKTVYVLRSGSATNIIYPNESTMDYRFRLVFDVTDYYSGTVTLKLFLGKDQSNLRQIYSKNITVNYYPGTNWFEDVAGWELYWYGGFPTIKSILDYAGITGTSCAVCMSLKW